MKTIDEIVAEFGTRFVSRIDDDTSVIGKTVGEGITDTTFWRKEAIETWLRTTLTEQKAQILQEAERRAKIIYGLPCHCDQKQQKCPHDFTPLFAFLQILKTLGEELSSKGMDE
jgi:erythromycin esterase-like protein